MTPPCPGVAPIVGAGGEGDEEDSGAGGVTAYNTNFKSQS